ncbi:MAG: OmpP1/FadL family transporter [bacterium]
MHIERTMNNIIFFVILILCVLLTPRMAHADDMHYNNMLIGERATGLGGAYMAISDDPSGLYYNPAGIVYSAGSKLSASMNAYYKEKKQYEKVLGNYDWERESSTLLPNFFGVTQPFSNGTVGFSYAVTDAMIENQDQTFHNVITPVTVNGKLMTDDKCTINFNNEDHTYNFGPSYAKKVSDSFAVGTTLYLHYRKNQSILNQLSNLWNSEGSGYYIDQWDNLYTEKEELGIRPIFGFMLSPPKGKFSLGLTLSRTIIFNSDRESQNTLEILTEDASDDIIRPDPMVVTSDKKREYPYIITLGTAFFPSNSLLVSGDITYYTGTDDEIAGKRRSFVNGAIGTEYYFNKTLALRMGFFSNLANTYKIESDKSNQPEHVNIYGGGFSLSHFTRYSSITIGIQYKYGKGETQTQSGIHDVTISSLMAYMGSSYSF